jgi:hypothetical protein
MTGASNSENPPRMTHFMSRLIPLVAALLAVQTPVTVADPTTLALGGAWKFQLDAKGAGLAEKWFSRSLEDSVQLPGTTDENKRGILWDKLLSE